MDTSTSVIVIVVVIAIAAALGFWFWSRNRRSTELRERFGPEYHRALEEHGDRARAEAALEGRKQRVEHLQIRPLTNAEHDYFSDQWRSVQARFVDDPQGAITEADTLVKELMRTRGYPMGDFEQRAADISVDHSHVVEHYRAAHAAMPSFGKRDLDTEELRQAMVHYRALFEELLEQPQSEHAAA